MAKTRIRKKKIPKAKIKKSVREERSRTHAAILEPFSELTKSIVVYIASRWSLLVQWQP